MKVRIIQVLCPLRHCILAVIYESPDGEPGDEQMALLKTTTADAIAAGVLNPWCGLCHSRQWAYEDRVTIFKTREEAMRVAPAVEAQQIRTAKLLRPNPN